MDSTAQETRHGLPRRPFAAWAAIYALLATVFAFTKAIMTLWGLPLGLVIVILALAWVRHAATKSPLPVHPPRDIPDWRAVFGLLFVSAFLPAFGVLVGLRDTSTLPAAYYAASVAFPASLIALLFHPRLNSNRVP